MTIETQSNADPEGGGREPDFQQHYDERTKTFRDEFGNVYKIYSKAEAIAGELKRTQERFSSLLQGDFPEISLNPEVFPNISELNSLLSSHPDLVLIYGDVGVSLMNVKAVKLLFEQHPEVFPQEVNPLEWLRNHPKEWYCAQDGDYEGDWQLRQIRYGLLSGYEADSVKRFGTYNSAHRKITTFLDEVALKKAPRERFQLISMLMDPKVSEEEKRLLFEKITPPEISSDETNPALIHAAQPFTPEEKQAVIDVRKGDFQMGLTFDDRAKDRYARQIQERREKCAIEVSPAIQEFFEVRASISPPSSP
jgi:hypothetical protein